MRTSSVAGWDVHGSPVSTAFGPTATAHVGRESVAVTCRVVTTGVTSAFVTVTTPVAGSSANESSAVSLVNVSAA